MTGQDLRWRAEYYAFRLAAMVIDILNVRQTRCLAEGMAWVFVHVLPRKWTRHRVAFDNLKQAFGDRYSPAELDDIIQGMWAHLFRLVAEIVQFPRKVRLRNCREVITFRRRNLAVKALATGRPVFLLGGHFGNWEATNITFGVFGFLMGIVACKLDNPYLHRWFVDSREQTGHQLLLKHGGVDGMADILNDGGNIGLLCDQDAGRRGAFVNFFGRPASTYRSIALLAIEYDALLVVGYGIRLPDDFEKCRWAAFEIGCEEVIDPREITAKDEVQEITQRFTSALQRAIERHPEQYFWVHRRWKTDPKTRKKLTEADEPPVGHRAA